MILSDRSIREAVAGGRLGIEPFDPALVQPSSIDVRLGHTFLVLRAASRPYIDVRQPAEELLERLEVGPEEPLFVHPRELVLGSTVERVTIPDDLVGRLEGRSSLGRLGVVVHSTSGFLDAGFSGTITLELSSLAALPIALYPGMRIGQLSFSRMTTPAERPYGPQRGSKYQGQVLPTGSRLSLDFVPADPPGDPSGAPGCGHPARHNGLAAT